MQNSDKKPWLICIDDTDDIGTKGTGEIAEEIAGLLSDDAQQAIPMVTRHQLFVHPDIPYTSHNSAMCFKLDSSKSFDEIKSIAVAHLLEQSAEASDPGLAILDLTADYHQQALIEFGREAKSEVKTKQQAYLLAERLGISLTEHGGTGQGVIGALAGLGLRMYGMDGRVKGQIQFENLGVSPLTVEAFLRQTGLEGVVSTCGKQLDSDESLVLTGKVKAIYWDHKFSLLVYNREGCWCNALKQHLKGY